MHIIYNILRALWNIIVFFILVLCVIGFWYQLPGGIVTFVITSFFLICLGVFVLITEWTAPWRSRTIIVIIGAGYILWWSSIHPMLDRDWAPELAHTVSADISNKHAIHIKNIRDFDWETPSNGHVKWRDETYDIDQLEGVNIYLSYWMGPYIAHSLIGFDFSDGRHLVFSAEIRRTQNQSFSAVGGFFKEFELAMIAATEEDIIKLRSDVRGEHIYRYPLKVSKERIQKLFLTYLKTGNELTVEPKFYNTLTTNCTTVIFDMVRIFDPGIPSDWRILFSGQLPVYLYENKLVNTDIPLPQLIKDSRITPQNGHPRNQYSRDIRAGQKLISN